MPADDSLKEKKLPKAKPTSGMQMCRVLCVGLLHTSVRMTLTICGCTTR